MASATTDERIVPAVLVKGGRMLVSLLNTDGKAKSVEIKLPPGMRVHGGVETRLWEAARGDVTPRSGRLEQCGDAQSWTFVVPAQALVHFVFDVDIGK